MWLPVAHCEFNAIELIWANVKNKVADKNKTFKVADVLRLCTAALESVPSTVWKNAVEHVRKLEKVYTDRAHYLEVQTEPLLINLQEDSSSSSNYSSDESTSDESD